MCCAVFGEPRTPQVVISDSIFERVPSVAAMRINYLFDSPVPTKKVVK